MIARWLLAVVLALPGAALALDRIVALAPNLAELADAAGAGDRLVGVAVATDLPAHARTLPVVASAGNVNIEQVIALRPQLVLAWRSGNPARALARLAALGMPLLVLEPTAIDDIPHAIREIGRRVGTEPAAERAALEFAAAIAALPRAARPVRVFVEVWHTPLVTVSGRHLISALVARCGGVNVFADAPGLAPPVSLEGLLTSRAELIIANAAIELPERWQRARLVPAVAAGRVVPLDPRALHSQSPRFLPAARALCDAVAST